jgi:xanthine/uracil/vitamin C permease (AzgA family)
VNNAAHCCVFSQFTYSIVGFHGSGRITYQEALAAVFLEGYVLLRVFSSSARKLTAS